MMCEYIVDCIKTVLAVVVLAILLAVVMPIRWVELGVRWAGCGMRRRNR